MNSPLAILPLIALFSTIFLVFILYTKAPKNMAAYIWIIMLFSFLLWSIGEFAQKWMGDDPAVFKWMALCTIHGDLFPAIFLVFCLIYPFPERWFQKSMYLIIFIIIGSKVVSTILTLVLGNYDPPLNWTEDMRYGYYPYMLALQNQVSPVGDWYLYFGLGHTIVLISLGAFVLSWKYWTSENKSIRYGVRLILVGLFLYLVIAATTIFLPLLGYFPPELASLGNLMFNVIVAYGILIGSVLLFSPTTETETEIVKDYSDELQIGKFYLSSIDKGVETFTDLVNHGYEGLYIGAVKVNLELTHFKRTPIVVLTEAGRGLRQYGNLQYVPADELKTFKASISTFNQSATRAVILLDNMDVILDKQWAPPFEFVELGMQIRDSPEMNAIWLYGTPIKEDDSVIMLRSVMEYPIVKKSIILDKLNSIISRIDVDRSEMEEQLKRLGRVEPVFYYLKYGNGQLTFNDDISQFEGILDVEPTNIIRIFVNQFQSKIQKDAYREILNELKDYGISRFEILLRAGDSYLVEEAFDDRGRVYDVFQDLMEREFDGVCITRTEPNKLRQRYLLPRETEVFWLTQDRKEEHDIKPAPEYLMVHIKNFIDSHKNEPGVLLLDGLEYLITFQGDQFESYLKVMRRISDLISQSKVILLIPYDPEALPADRIAIFRRSGIEVITRDMLT